MANRGYPDDDGSRETANPRTDTGRQRLSLCDVSDLLANTVGGQISRGGNMTTDAPIDLDGNQVCTPVRYPMPGNAGRSSAAYPPKPEDPNSRD